MSAGINEQFDLVCATMDAVVSESLVPPGVKRETMARAIVAWMDFSNMMVLLDADVKFKIPKPNREGTH
jgi:hypothetical protein